ncbi:MAG: hypothetical protein RR653_11375 [Clostridia bacterium]
MPIKTADGSKAAAQEAPTAPRSLHVLMTYRALIPSVRWFGMEQLRYLAREGMLELRTVPEKKLTADDCRWADWVVLTRADTPFELWLARKLREMGRKLFYVLDDDLAHVPTGLGCSVYYRDATVLALGKAVRDTCDVLVTHSPLLEGLYGASFEKVVRVEQPAMLEQASKAMAACQAVPSGTLDTAPHKEAVRIGFSGSPDRAADVQQVLADALGALKKRYGERVEIEFFGARPPLVDELHLPYIPYTSSAEQYYQTMAQRHWDIGLAPLEDTQFYRCKYYNKFVEYCTYGIVGVYSDLPPYQGVVRNGQDGILCAPSDWFQTLCALVENAQARAQMAQAAACRARSFSLSDVSLRFWQGMGTELTSFRATEAKLPAFPFAACKLAKASVLAGQTFRRHGLRLFSIAWNRFC